MSEDFVSNPYKKEEKKTLSEVVISQIDVCRKEFSKELKKGFQQQAIVEGQVITINVPDQRHTNIQSTKTLHDLLFYFFDTDMKTSLKNLNKVLKEMGDTYHSKYILRETNPRLIRMAKQSKLIQNSPIGERIFQEMMNYQSEIYRTMFRELILLFKRKHELSGKRTIGYKD